MQNTLTIWWYCGKFIFPCLRLCQPDSIICHGLGINVGSLCPPWPPLSYHPSWDIVNCAHFSCITSSTCSFHHQVSDFNWWFLKKPQTSVAASSRGSVFQLWPSWINTICSISISTSSGGNCNSCFYLEGWLELGRSMWIPRLPGLDAWWELVFLHMGNVSGEVTHYLCFCTQQMSTCHLNRVATISTFLSQIPGGNSDLGLGLFNFLGLGWAFAWFASMTGACFSRPSGNQIWDVTTIPFKTTTGTAYSLFYIRLYSTILFGARFDGAAVLPGFQLSFRCRGNLAFFLGHQPLVGIRPTVEV